MHTDRIRPKDKEESNKYIHGTYLALLVLALANHNAVFMHYGSLVLHRRCREEESNKMYASYIPCTLGLGLGEPCIQKQVAKRQASFYEMMESVCSGSDSFCEP